MRITQGRGKSQKLRHISFWFTCHLICCVRNKAAAPGVSMWQLLAYYIYQSLGDVKRRVTACTVVKDISVSPHDSLGCHLLLA